MKSQNEQELIALGKQLGQRLEKQDVVILTGDLGAGKTTFTKGLAQGLGIRQMIKSPTYTIVREYEGRLPLYHRMSIVLETIQIRLIWMTFYLVKG